MSEPCYAVWYWRHTASEYELFHDENDAARFGAAIEANEQGMVAGVQGADGRFFERDVWAAFLKEEARREEEEAHERRARALDPPAVSSRTVLNPFDNTTVEVPLDAPSWLGHRPHDLRGKR